MSIVAELTNKRVEYPQLDLDEIMTSDKLLKSDEWKYVIKKNCKTIVLNKMKNKMVSLIKVRGIIYDLINPNLELIYVSGVRCPIHSVERVSKMGNKTIIDITFSTDPTCIKIYNGSQDIGTCEINFPSGFSPICYTSENCQFQYLSCISRPIGLMAIDISPISFTLLWNTPGECCVTIESDKVQTIKDKIHRLDVVNLKPNTCLLYTSPSPRDS